jgi:hypothetical protein
VFEVIVGIMMGGVIVIPTEKDMNFQEKECPEASGGIPGQFIYPKIL